MSSTTCLPFSPHRSSGAGIFIGAPRQPRSPKPSPETAFCRAQFRATRAITIGAPQRRGSEAPSERALILHTRRLRAKTSPVPLQRFAIRVDGRHACPSGDECLGPYSGTSGELEDARPVEWEKVQRRASYGEGCEPGGIRLGTVVVPAGSLVRLVVLSRDRSVVGDLFAE